MSTTEEYRPRWKIEWEAHCKRVREERLKLLENGYTTSERGSGFTMQELTDMAKKKLDKAWNVPYDEQRDLGYDDQRDWRNDGPGDYGWGWDDQDPQPVQD